MYKVLLIPGIVILSLAIALYHSKQTNIELEQSKNKLIESLKAEIEWKDGMIRQLNKQAARNEEYENNQYDSLSSTEPDHASQNRILNASEESGTSDQIKTYQSQITDLSSRLERRTDLLRSLSQIAPFSKINLIDDELDDYFERITQISQGSLYNTEYQMNPDRYGSIQFDASDIIPESGKAAFGANESRVYAHFDIPDYPYQSVLIKWYKQGSPEPLEMGYFDINTNSGQNYAWIEPKSSWDEGKYFVEIYAASESPELLSAGSYVVE